MDTMFEPETLPFAYFFTEIGPDMVMTTSRGSGGRTMTENDPRTVVVPAEMVT
jgi:hypothetical protein